MMSTSKAPPFKLRRTGRPAHPHALCSVAFAAGFVFNPAMARTAQVELARQFLALHDGRKTLVLPNAWDVASARIFEGAGFPAIGTTSAGIANALGYPDGQKISRSEMLAVVHRIAAAVGVPVTA